MLSLFLFWDICSILKDRRFFFARAHQYSTNKRFNKIQAICAGPLILMIYIVIVILVLSMTVQTTFLTDFNLIGYRHYKPCFECTTKLLWFYARDQPFSILSFLYKKKKKTVLLKFLTTSQETQNKPKTCWDWPWTSQWTSLSFNFSCPLTNTEEKSPQ